MRNQLLCTCLVLFVSQPAFAQRLSGDQQTSGEAFRKVFRPVVKDARTWTVTVFGGGEQVAMGTVIDSAGYVLTKASQLAGQVVCRLSDGRSFSADIVGVAADHDLAMLKIDATDLPTVKWSAAKTLELGQWVVTADRDELPVGVGVMSVRQRSIRSDRGVLGVTLREDGEDLIITRVFPKSGAEAAGLREGDVILSLAERNVAGLSALVNRLKAYRPGDTAMLLVRRGLQEIDAAVVLRNPPNTNFTRGAIQNRMGGSLSLRRSGFPAVVQHDTVLQPEECGGPLIDLEGQAVGVNIARAGRTETYALTAAVIKPLLADLKAGRMPPPRPTRFWMSTPPPPPLPED